MDDKSTLTYTISIVYIRVLSRLYRVWFRQMDNNMYSLSKGIFSPCYLFLIYVSSQLQIWIKMFHFILIYSVLKTCPLWVHWFSSFLHIALAELLESLLRPPYPSSLCTAYSQMRVNCYSNRYFFTRNQTPKTTILIALLMSYIYFFPNCYSNYFQGKKTTYNIFYCQGVDTWKRKGRYKLVYIMAVQKLNVLLSLAL